MQYRNVFSPMSSEGGDNIENRWKISFFNKAPLHGDNFLNETQEFLRNNNLLNRWNIHYNGYYFTNNGDKFHEFKMVSINPTIIVGRPLDNKELLSSKKSDYKYKNIVEYATFIKFQKDLFYFSPDLNILPQPISLSERQVKTIYWDKIFNSGSIELQKKGGFIYTKRFANKNSKNTRKDEKYNHSYHLHLIPRELEMKDIVKEIKKEINI
jgi:hypothetical protein